MSILIRTGSGKTDLSYTDNAVKNLKVLQKTGTKSVHWITTQAGTTYNNILQKRGVKDLFYGNITIPSDIPEWCGNPYSGSKPIWQAGAVYPQWTMLYTEVSHINSKTLNVAANNWDYGTVAGTNIITTFKPIIGNNIRIRLLAERGWDFISSRPTVNLAKIFFIDSSNENNKLVLKLQPVSTTFSNSGGSSGTSDDDRAAKYDMICKIIDIYSNNFTLQYTTGKTFKVGIRTSFE